MEDLQFLILLLLTNSKVSNYQHFVELFPWTVFLRSVQHRPIISLYLTNTCHLAYMYTVQKVGVWLL